MIQDPFKYAAERRTLAGEIPLGELGRLASVLLDQQGSVAWTLSGERAADGNCYLRLELNGVLTLGCQRCLGRLEWTLDDSSVLRLVRPGTPISNEELEIDEFDTVEAVADMDVLALVEDEILLAVPIAPRHESCEPPRPADGADKESPFAALAKLRKPGGA